MQFQNNFLSLPIPIKGSNGHCMFQLRTETFVKIQSNPEKFIQNQKMTLKDFAKKNLDFLQDNHIIKDNMTGKVIIEMNLNEGGLRDGLIIKTEAKY